MSDVYDEKYAFPIHPDVRHDVEAGMTLRDYFAAAALQGMLADSTCDVPGDRYAFAAYQLADAMMKERAKKDNRPD